MDLLVVGGRFEILPREASGHLRTPELEVFLKVSPLFGELRWFMLVYFEVWIGLFFRLKMLHRLDCWKLDQRLTLGHLLLLLHQFLVLEPAHLRPINVSIILSEYESFLRV